MLTNPEKYRKLSARARWKLLSEMTLEESIALGEALLTSEIMDLADFSEEDHPLCLAISLGVSPRYVESGNQGESETKRI